MRPITGADRTATHVPLCLPRDQKPSDAPPECPMVGSRRLASPRASRFRMHKRKLLIGLATAGLLLAGFGAATMPASAEQRTLLVTLVGGAQVTVTVDVPPGTPTDQIQIPGVSAPIASVQDITPAAARAARPRSDAATASQVQVDPNGGQSQATRAAANSGAVAARPRRARPTAATTADSANTPTQEPQAGQQAQQDHGQARQGSSSGRGCQEGQGRRGEEGQGRRRQGAAGRRPASARRPADARQPHPLRGAPRPRADRRPELLHRQVPDPAVPAADLPGRRHRVRRALGGPGRDQRDRDRLRAQPQRLDRRRAGLDAVHALDVEALRRRRQPRRPQGPVQPGRRDLRRRALPEGRPGRPGRPPRDLRLQPRRLVRRLRPHARASDRRPARRPRRLAHRPDAGPLPRPRQGPLRRRHRRHRRRQEARSRRAERRPAGRPRRARAAGSTSSPRPARR